MLALGTYLSRLGLVFWLGEMLFFIAIFAPRVFRVLPREMAGQLQASIFPAYYTAGLISAALVLVGIALRRMGGDALTLNSRKLTIALGLVAFAAIVFAYSRWSLTPELNGLRPQIESSSEAAARFKELHSQSVKVNGAALLALLVLNALL